MPLRRRLQLLLLILCALAFSAKPAHAADAAPPAYDPHRVDGSSLGGIIDLSQSWLVYGGDDPRFADPNFDDSHWQAVSLSQHLNHYGIHDQPVVWYRIHVQVPASANDLSLSLYRFRGSMEAYVNGARTGGLGQMNGGGELRQNSFHYLMPIPQSALNGGDLVIAVRAAIGRVSKGEMYAGGLSEAALGESNLLQEEASLSVFRDLSSNGYRLLLQAITMFVLVALVIALPRQREYLALVISFLFTTADNVAHILSGLNVEHFSSAPIQILVEFSLGLAAFVAFLEFINLALGKTRVRWIRLIQFSFTLSILIDAAWIIAVIGRRVDYSPALNLGYSLLKSLALLPYLFLLPGILFWDWRKRRNSDAGLLLVPVLLVTTLDGYQIIGDILVQLHAIDPIASVVPIRSLSIQWNEVSDVSANLALLVYIILRVVRTVREGARYAAEVEAAQTVQKVLLARSQQPTPGFKVETVYLPASEVGGDFFLVSPGAVGSDASIVAIVGDVAGKGMLAAMRVSVILGILRREDSRDPGIVLRRLNDAMILQGDMGLTTACCVRIEQNGRFLLANAGHISPYIAGREIAGREVMTAGALPLGIAPDQEYEQTEGSLAEGETLVLMSDGVVEARSAEKELYGFERLASLISLPANEIAQAASLFGQEDDITVMTLSCVS